MAVCRPSILVAQLFLLLFVRYILNMEYEMIYKLNYSIIHQKS